VLAGEPRELRRGVLAAAAGAKRRGLIPARCWRRSEAATVLRDTRSPSARREVVPGLVELEVAVPRLRPAVW
jgi:hypothetical protein